MAAWRRFVQISGRITMLVAHCISMPLLSMSNWVIGVLTEAKNCSQKTLATLDVIGSAMEVALQILELRPMSLKITYF